MPGQTMNFFDDFVSGIERELAAEGVTLTTQHKGNKVVLLAKYSEYIMRKISPASRIVHYSMALTRSADFSAFSSAIDALKKIAESGSDLTPYQSKTIDQFEYPEFLLFDWGIQHLHLGKHLPGRSLSQRTGHLLFAMFRNTDAYFITILPHGSWAELDLLNIIDNEWPHLLNPFVLRDVIDIRPIPSPTETIELRRAGVTIMQKLASGRIVAPPGGGITTAKTSAAAMLKAQRMIRIILTLEENVKQNEAEVRKILGSSPTSRLYLAQIHFGDSQAFVGADDSPKSVRLKL